jgi:hypothetical protein
LNNNIKVKGCYYNKKINFYSFFDKKSKTSFLISKSNIIGDFYKGCNGTVIEKDGGLKILIEENNY